MGDYLRENYYKKNKNKKICDKCKTEMKIKNDDYYCPKCKNKVQTK